MVRINPAVIAYNSKLLRGLLGWSRRELAEACGISEGTIKNAEQTMVPYSTPNALAIVYVLEHTIQPEQFELFEQLITEPVTMHDQWGYEKEPQRSGADIFQNNICKLRYIFGLSQRHLADLSGFSQSYICGLERNCKSLGAERHMRLIDTFLELAGDDKNLVDIVYTASRKVISGIDLPRYYHVKDSIGDITSMAGQTVVKVKEDLV